MELTRLGDDQLLAEVERREHLGPEAGSEVIGVAWAIATIRHEAWIDDEQGVGIEPVAGCHLRALLAQLPVVEPVLADVVVEREQPTDPGKGLPAPELESLSQSCILLGQLEGVDFRVISEDAHPRCLANGLGAQPPREASSAAGSGWADMARKRVPYQLASAGTGEKNTNSIVAIIQPASPPVERVGCWSSPEDARCS